MNKDEIIQHLQDNHKAFNNCIASLSEEQFNFAAEGKWNAGQTLDHLHRAVEALNTALILPKFSLALLFGKANRSSKTYEDLVKKYQGKLADGGKAHGRYLPKKIAHSKQQKTEAALQKSVSSICNHISSFSEEQLDQYILPHPLLGKITMREMMYFTMYHAEHHRAIVLRDTMEESFRN